MSAYHLTIDGKEVKTERSFAVLNPADESVVAMCPEGTMQLVDAAVASARRALPQWSATSDAQRAGYLMAIADLIEKNHKELAKLVTLEQGKTQSGLGANAEVGGAAGWCRVTAGLSLKDETIQDDLSGTIVVHRKPVGVVGSITPWNWPLMIATWHIAPALRVGCTVVIKPSPFTPLSTLRLVELMNEVLPPGVVNSVTGGPELGTHLTGHPGVDKIVFTGSVATGKKIMASAAGSVKRVTLELGGNDAGIVLPGTNIDPLLEKLFWGCFINGGQTCAALKRLYVHEDQYEEVVAKFTQFVAQIPVGPGMDPKSLIGPVSNKMQLDKVVGYVEDARARGARIVCGGVRPAGPGFFYPLTVIADVSDEMRVVSEEQFGPVIPIIKYRTVEEAIRRANAVDVGLGGSVWGNDPKEAAKYAQQLECGTAWVNQHSALHPLAPFGGIKCSGLGVENNLEGLHEYTTIQVLSVALQ
jgi:acyl-CoA reductase-like NAD-dependent aldehyde dehydrogenase